MVQAPLHTALSKSKKNLPFPIIQSSNQAEGSRVCLQLSLATDILSMSALLASSPGYYPPLSPPSGTWARVHKKFP